ncbi:predicted protein [Postia placenta Mad-698-R]|nr:predicted protein [Postia placenta Mad-698-R]
MTKQIAASSPPQKGLPYTLEEAPGVVQPVQTRRSLPIKNSLATTRDTHLLTQKTYSPSYGSTSNLYKQQKARSHPSTNNHLNSLKFTLMRKDLGKTWADTYYKKSAGGVQVYSTWANFVATLEEVFPKHGTRIKAHQILMKLPERQKDRKTALSLGNYVTRFEQLASKAQLKDTEVNGTNRVKNNYHTLHANFVKGLLKELYFALTTRVARDRPNTMKACYNEVQNTDTAKQGALVVTDTRDYGEPMDIDAAAVASTFTSTSGGRKWELGAAFNEANWKLHRDENLCFYCHIKGHSAKDCHKKAAARQGGGRPNQEGSGKDDFCTRIKTLSADKKQELYEELTMEDF